MAEGVHYVFSCDIHVSIFNGGSPFEEFEEEIEALLGATPGLSAQQKKDLVYRNLGRDVKSELSCQPEKENRNADAPSRNPVRMPDPEDPETRWVACYLCPTDHQSSKAACYC